MTYKLVKNENDELIAYGPNDEMYEPALEQGQTLVIEDAEIAEPLIEAFTQKLQAEQEVKKESRTSALAKLAALGLTEEEIAAL
jgi:hypothetical protein